MRVKSKTKTVILSSAGLAALYLSLSCAQKKISQPNPPSGTTTTPAVIPDSSSGGPIGPPAVSPDAPVNTEVSYPGIDPELGEKLHDNEMATAANIGAVIEEQVRDLYKGGKRFFRDAHPRAHGCFHAEFAVDPAIPADFAHGVFAKGNRFKSIIRFSNADHDAAKPDIAPDGRGMAVKLLDVPGKKLLETEANAKTQDFIFLSHPVFVMTDPSKYTDFIKAFTQPGLANQVKTAQALGPKGAILAAALKNKLISSPIQIPYFSMVPYQLGLGKDKSAVRYKVEPCAINGKDTIPFLTKDPYYLRARMNAHFKKSDACMDFFIQKRTKDAMSVEDSTDEWPSPWVKVATLTMKKEAQDNPDTAEPTHPVNLACDKLSFNPWHALPEHKPLGVMNRIRKVVYDHISKLRHTQNKEEKKEP